MLGDGELLGVAGTRCGTVEVRDWRPIKAFRAGLTGMLFFISDPSQPGWESHEGRALCSSGTQPGAW